MAAPANFDEMNGIDGVVRDGYKLLAEWLQNAPPDLLANRKVEAEHFFRRIGITFNVRKGSNSGSML